MCIGTCARVTSEELFLVIENFFLDLQQTKGLAYAKFIWKHYKQWKCIVNFIHKSCVFIIFFLFSNVIFALEKIELTHNDPYMVGVDLGVGHPGKLGNSTQFSLGYSTFIYHPKDDNSWPFYGGVSISKNLIQKIFYTIQSGISYHYFSPMRVKGTLLQGITPPHYQANYFYAITTSQVLFETLLRQPWNHCFSPYITIGLGVALNHARNFSTDVPAYLTLTPSYRNNTTTSFSYVIGLGFDYLIDPKLSLGMSYRFNNLGSAGLGKGQIRDTYVGEKLRQSYLYVNTLAVHLNYFI